MAGLSGDLIVALCPKPCKGPITWGQRRLLPDGTVEVTGERPPPLCDACPERDNPKAPIRHIEVLHGFPPGGNVSSWGVGDIENAVRIKLVYDDPPESDGIRCRE